MSGESAPDPLRGELAELVAAFRDYVVRQAAAGTTGFPRALARPSRGAEPSAPHSAAVPVVAGGELAADVALPRASAAHPVAEPSPRAVLVEPGSRPAAGPAAAVAAPSAMRGTVDGAAGRGSVRGSPQALARLAELEREVAGCERCALHRGRQRTVFARGTGTSGICFVGEGPGADEDAQGIPFVGAAGQLLDRMIEGMGLVRDEVYICNIVKCRPPDNRKPQPEEMAACRPFLEEQLELIDPEVMVALGATAVQGLFGTTAGITRLRGTWRLYRGKIAVMPTFHPAYVLRTPSAKREVWNDLKEVLRHLGREVPGRSQ